MDDFIHIKRKISNGLKLNPPSNATLLQAYRQLLKLKKIKASIILEKYLTKRPVRTMSGVAVISVLSKPYSCPGKCLYCPSEKGIPKSYLSNEPAVMRAILNAFDPWKQVSMRLKALEANGHTTDKIELIVLGGTWSVYDHQYQSWFIKRCFDACNQFNNKKKASTTLAKAQTKNEKAKHRIIGLCLETRPDQIDEREVIQMRKLGCTRVQLGVQAIDDQILTINKRGHDTERTVEATKLLKQTGFKIDYHMMPNLAGSTLAKDHAMYKKLFTSPDFQPDQIKIYPTIVNKNAPLYRWWQQGKWQPYSNKQLLNLLIKLKQATPYYVRITRLIRDIPSESISAGNKITNLRQLVQMEMRKEKLVCHCTRCREARGQTANLRQAKLFINQYKASDGTEYFISYENKQRTILYAFTRLRINNDPNNFIPELKNAALIRELHTYGKLIPLKTKSKGVQHEGFGKRLMIEAEKIAKKNKLKKIAVISGIGVREYYQKLEYHLEGTYMVKNI